MMVAMGMGEAGGGGAEGEDMVGGEAEAVDFGGEVGVGSGADGDAHKRTCYGVMEMAFDKIDILKWHQYPRKILNTDDSVYHTSCHAANNNCHKMVR
jgi:hypothetical protein